MFAGLAAFGVAYVVGEPPLQAAIAYEAGPAHSHAGDAPTAGADEHAHDESGGTVVPRSLQSTLGLVSATLLAAVTLGGLLGVLGALAAGRFGSLGVRATTLLVAGVGFVALYVVPFLAYPPNPPGVAQADTIGTRTSLYVVTLAISVIAAVTAVAVGRRMAGRWGTWYAPVAATLGYVVVAVVAVALLPGGDPVPDGFPADVLYAFRAASFLTQLTLWGVLGLVLAELLHRLTTRTTRLAAARARYTGRTDRASGHPTDPA
ncbi:MAG: hypothetical protein JWP61_243 [Friedmanniella sp.]|nr:hypothetical protein [Friedmanniella sp.]